MPDTPLSPKLLVLKSAGRSLTGDVVRARYRFGRLIGTGGMSTIYEGEYLPLARTVALKALHAGAGDETRRRFRREYRLLATLEHPGLVRALDIDETPDGRLFFAMELLDGRSLDRAFDPFKPVDPVRIVRIGIQVCDVLHALHEQGIVHRDMKPANVFLLDGTDDQIKLLDLGIARLTTGYYEAAPDERPLTPTSQREHTRTGAVMGTRGYEPPESGRVKAEPRYDVFSTGVMLYRLLTAKLPSPPSQVRVTTDVPELPDSLADAIERAIAFDPRDRFSSAKEFQCALEASYREMAGKTPWPNASHSVEPSSRAGWWDGLVVGLAVGAAVTTAFFLAGKDPARQGSLMEQQFVPTTVPIDHDVASAPSSTVDIDDRIAPKPAGTVEHSNDEDADHLDGTGRSDPPVPFVEEPEVLEEPTTPAKRSQRALSNADFRRAMRSARDPMLVCMGMYPPGEAPDRISIRVHFDRGGVERVTFKKAPTSLVATCLEETVRTISFPRPRARATRNYVLMP